MKKNILISTLFTLFIIGNLVGQKSNLPGKLPWVNGNLPANSINYNYKVVQGDGSTLLEAQNEAVRALVNDLSSEKEVRISSETLMKTVTIENDNNQTFDADYRRNTSVKQDGFEVTFSRVDEYFEQPKDLNNGYRVWRLYAIGNYSQQVPKINYSNRYSMNDAGYRSLIVPGWGQFYKKSNGKGVMFLIGAAGSLGGFMYANNKHSYNINRSLETNNMDLKKQYVQKAGDFTTIKNITLGAAIGVWMWSVVDATSTEGVTKYAENKPMNFNLVSDPNNSLALSIKYKF